MWSLYDDHFDELPVIKAAWKDNPAVLGLHVLATTACNRTLSDGVIDPDWLELRLPKKRAERTRLLASAVKFELFFLLPAGETRVVIAWKSKAKEVEIGPFAEARYVIREFLRWHEDSETIKARRRTDAIRKRGKRGGSSDNGYPEPNGSDVSSRTTTDVRLDVRPDSARTSSGTPRGGARPPARERTVPFRAGPSLREEAEEARGATHPKLAEVIAIFEAAPGVLIEPMSLDGALKARADVDPVEAAQLAASWVHEGNITMRSATGLLYSATKNLANDAARLDGVRIAAEKRELARGTGTSTGAGRGAGPAAPAPVGGGRRPKYSRVDDVA